MNALIITLIIAQCILGPLYVHGTWVAFFWHEFPRLQKEPNHLHQIRADSIMPTLLAAIPVFGILSVGMAFFYSAFNKHGWTLKP